MLLKSPFSDVVIPEVGMHQAIFGAMTKHGNAISLINGVTGQQFTFAQVIDLSKRLASGLHRLGVRKGDIVSVYCPSAPELAFMFIATWANGASVTPTNPSYTEYEFLHHLQDSQATWLLTGKAQITRVKKACEQYRDIKRIITLEPAEGCVCITDLLQDDGALYPSDVKINAKEDVALIPYSSGTTGLPKGVMLTHYNLLANLMQMGHEDVAGTMVKGAVAGEKIMLNVLPLFHMYGIEAILLNALLSGATLVCLPRFYVRSYLEAVEKYKVTFLQLVPPMVVALNSSPLISRYDLSSVQNATSGAAPLKASTAEHFLKMLKIDVPFTNSYGMTEVTCGGILMGQRPPKPGAVGFLLPNMDGKIIDRETGKMLGPGQTGEICMRGPNVMKGYHNKPEATRNTLDSDGFLHSGDVGYYDDEGYVFIVDRMKELIKCKGFQVAPAELEALLLTHPDVDDAGVIGIPDEESGELPRAYVAKRPGSNITVDELHAFVNKRVASYKRLRGGLVFTDQIPKSMTGKILRRQLVDMYKAQKSKL